MQSVRPIRFEDGAGVTAQRFAVSRSILRDMIGDVRVTLADEVPVEARGLFWRHGTLSLTTLFLPALPYSIAAGGADASGLFMARAMGGPLSAMQAGRRVEAGKGDVLLLRADRAVSFAVPEGGRLDCAHMPSHALGEIRGVLEALSPRVVPATCLPLQLLTTYAGYLLQSELESERGAEMLVGHFYNLLPVLAEHLTRDAVPEGQRSRADSVKACIERNLADSAFSIEHVARAERISARAIQKLFQREGTTFSRFLLERRLEQAKVQLLLDTAVTSIGEIAFGLGFNDLTHFSRTFRKRYGVAPSALRRSGRVG